MNENIKAGADINAGDGGYSIGTKEKYDEFVKSRNQSPKTVAVIGAGIIGITTAYYLAKKGYKVTVYEQEPHAAMRTSFANGGQISVSNSEVWTTWSNVKKGIKWLFKKDAPLLIRPQLDFKQWKWIAKFLYNTATNQYEKNTSETIKMGLESSMLYKEIMYTEKLSFDQSPAGILHFYKDEQYFEAAKQAQYIYRKNGCEWDIVDTQRVKDLESKLTDVKGIVGGAWTLSDWTGDIHKFCIELERVLKKKYGVTFIYNSVTTKDTMQYMVSLYDSVVVCAGVGSVDIAKSVGDTLDIYPVKGYSITINNVDKKHLPVVSLLDDQAKIVTSSLGNRFRVAGTAELTGENYDIRHDRIKPLLDWVRTNFPNMDTSDYSSWACLRPMTPNMMPITKQSDKNSKVYYNTGHGHLGWTLAPYTAKLISEQI
jgi:D-amino-acid dehydrogenase